MATHPIIELKKKLITNKIIYFDSSDLLAKTSIKYNLYRVFRDPELTSSVLEYIQSFMEKKLVDVEFNTILPLNNYSALPYATDIAVSCNKSLLIQENGKFSTTLNGDETVLLVIDTINSESDKILINTIMKKLILFDVKIVGILIIFDQDIC